MNRYKENKCRLCQKVFCCKKCREQHESLKHKIFVDCNICLYGKTFLPKDLSECLIRHIKKQHWPLHCVICKKPFQSMEEILKENVCRNEHKHSNFKLSPYTPNQYQDQDENKCYLEPKMFCNLATSTPLQREENNLPEKIDIQVAATPVEINKEKIHYPDGTSIKRKVTFCETPITETCEDKENVEEDNIIDNKIMVTPISGNNSAVFYSAKQYLKENSINLHKESEIITSSDNKDFKIMEKKLEAGHEDSILWMSAVNTSPDFIDENKPPIDANNPTPVITKFIKKKVNVVLPIAVRKHSVELELPSDIHETSVNISKLEENAYKDHENSSETHQLLKKIVNANNVDYSSTNDANEASINASSIWTSMSKIIKSVANAVQELSGTTYDFKTPLKRSFIDDDLVDGPRVKRYKLTEIKCRPPIRQWTAKRLDGSREYHTKDDSSSTTLGGIQKRFVDKATQTENLPWNY